MGIFIAFPFHPEKPPQQNFSLIDKIAQLADQGRHTEFFNVFGSLLTMLDDF